MTLNKFTIFNRGYRSPIENVKKWLKVWDASDPPEVGEYGNDIKILHDFGR